MALLAGADQLRRGDLLGGERGVGPPVAILWLADADSSATAKRWRPPPPGTSSSSERSTRTCLRIWVASIGFSLDQIAEIEEEIGRKIRANRTTEREQGRIEIQAVAAFAPGWIDRSSVREALEELTFEIDLDTEIEFPEDDQLGELRGEAADLFEPT